MTEKSTPQNQNDQRIDDEIKAAKSGDKWAHMDHAADWYSEKCTYIRQEQNRRELDK